MELQAGLSKANITPPIGCRMAGFGGRTHGAEGVHDDLWVRVLYLSDGNTELALAGVEMCGLSGDSIEAVRARVESETGIPGSHVFISATHTHSGPAYTPRDDALGERNLRVTEDKIAGAVAWAKSRRQPASVRVGRQSVQCGVNRREWRDGRIVLGVNPEGPVYPFVHVMEIRDGSGATMGTWFMHPCHPVVMGESNYLVSGDFVGAASRFIEANAGGIALFANGCAANINSQAFHGKFEDVERLGRRLGSAVVHGLTETENLGESDHGGLTSRERTIALPTDPVPSTEETESEMERLRAEIAATDPAGDTRWRHYWAKVALRQAGERLQAAREDLREAPAPVTVQLVTIGDIALLGIPAEVFIETGREIQDASPFSHTLIAGYTNGSWGYLPTAEAFPEGGYEVDTRIRHLGLPITAAAAGTLAKGCVQLLQEAWSEVSGVRNPRG